MNCDKISVICLEVSESYIININKLYAVVSCFSHGFQ